MAAPEGCGTQEQNPAYGSLFSLKIVICDLCFAIHRIENKIKPGIFDEKRGIAALLIKNSGFYFVRNP